MQLLRLADVEKLPRDRVFRYSRLNAAAAVLVALGVIAALLYPSITAHRRFGYYFSAGICLFLALASGYVTARFRPSNWLVRMNDAGLYIQFRSYLNYRLPAEDLTVVFLPFQEVRSARLIRERAQVRDVQGRGTTEFRRYIELEIAVTTAPLEAALQAEIDEKAPTEKRWYGSTSTLYLDHPVRMPAPPGLQIRWQATPGAKAFLHALRPNVAIAEPVSLKQDFSDLQALSREEQQKKLAELAQRGDFISAIYAAQRLYGCSLAEAKAIVDQLKDAKPSGA